MKSKQKEELKTREIGELKKLINDSKDVLFKLRIEKSQNKLKNLRSIFMERKKIALMLTVINAKEKIKEVVKKEEVKKIVKSKKGKKV